MTGIDGDTATEFTVERLLENSTSEIHTGSGERFTPADLLERGRALASVLRADGLTRGDRVAVQLTNEVLYLDLLAAAAVSGLTIMSVNTRFSPDLAQSLTQRSGARLVVTGAERPDMRNPSKAPAIELGGRANDRFVIFTTSGTTSAPKLVVHTQRSIAQHAAEVATHLRWDSDDRVMVALPLCGTFGLASLMGALAGNARVVLPEVFEAAETARLIEEHAVTAMHGSDDMFHRLLATDADLSTIVTAGYGRFNSSLDGIVDRAAARGLALTGLYGMSECQALFSFRHAQGRDTDWIAGGDLTSPSAAYRIVDGELQLQGPSLFEGYLADGGDTIDEELTARHRDGPWFRTGDLAEADGPRALRFLTRMGDVLRLSGFLVAPAEIENCITELDAIDAAQVVAVERPTGNRPVAFVVLAPDAILDEAAVIAHCQERLAKFKSPVRVIALDSFPVTDGPNGVKIQKAKLRDLADDAVGSPGE